MAETNPVELLAQAALDYAQKHNGQLPAWMHALPETEFDRIAEKLREVDAAA